MPEEESEPISSRIDFGGINSVMVGSSDVFERVRDFLIEDEGKRILVTGMAGVGKTTIAKKVFEDPLIKKHFELRAWVKVGRICQSAEIVQCILAQEDPNTYNQVFTQGDDDSDLHLDVVGVSDSSSSPSCVDNCSQQKCLDSDDDYEDVRVDGDERRSYNLTAAEFQLLKVLVQRFMEDKQFGGHRNDADVRSRCMIRSLLQVPAIKDDFVKTKAREERDGVEMLVGVISEMMVILFLIAFDPGGDVSMLLLSSTLPVVPWFPP